MLSVADNGDGIPTHMLERVFDMFTQLEGPRDRTRERAQDGLGIGLALVKRLVEMHNGEIEARSEGPGRGSEFIVRLPMAVERVTRDAASRRRARTRRPRRPSRGASASWWSTTTSMRPRACRACCDCRRTKC